MQAEELPAVEAVGERAAGPRGELVALAGVALGGVEVALELAEDEVPGRGERPVERLAQVVGEGVQARAERPRALDLARLDRGRSCASASASAALVAVLGLVGEPQPLRADLLALLEVGDVQERGVPAGQHAQQHARVADPRRHRDRLAR